MPKTTARDAREPEAASTNASAPAYDAEFFRALENGVARSASVGSDVLMQLFAPRSAVDVGCGTGIWLAALREKGVSEVLGVDGPWVPSDRLAIPQSSFLSHDLTQPLALDRRFDLALSLETAEHLPHHAAPQLVASLTRLAPVVVFSAAIPEQGGRNHLNEQWPSYWVDLFARHGYEASTRLRERFWREDALEVWYRQNVLCFADPAHAAGLGALFGRDALTSAPLDIVHPDLFVRVAQDRTRQAAYAERLERELRYARRDIRNTESNLQSTENNLKKTRDELWRIKNSRTYRFAQRLSSARARAGKFLQRLRPGDQKV